MNNIVVGKSVYSISDREYARLERTRQRFNNKSPFCLDWHEVKVDYEKTLLDVIRGKTPVLEISKVYKMPKASPCDIAGKHNFVLVELPRLTLPTGKKYAKLGGKCTVCHEIITH